TATAGTLPVYTVENHQRHLEARMFFVAYTLDTHGAGPDRRPLTFSYNGGPGAASVYVDIGGFGPRRVAMNVNGTMPSPPFHMVDNNQTWLPFTDLVFVDAIGTGYSRAVSPAMLKKASAVQGDIAAFGEFIRAYLLKYDRMGAPLFLAGESYGTFRSAGLAGYLDDHGIALNGVMLLSSVLNLETLDYAPGNDLPYVLYLPSLATVAWYHHKLSPQMEAEPVAEVARQAGDWALNGYQQALDAGDQLQGAARQAAIAKMAHFTGLSPSYLDDFNLRVKTGDFMTQLLRGQKLIIGRLDARITGFNRTPGDQMPDYDPSDAMTGPPFTQMFLQYVRQELGYKSAIVYYTLGGGIDRWNWQSHGFGGGYADTSVMLESAFAKNHYLHLFVAEGYYDLATPFFEAQYSIRHLFLPPAEQKNITVEHYQVGHMIYLKRASRIQLAHDAQQFITAASR
ncbi:MAG: S10 family peptidase, partial [Terriglobales bacterium]